MSLSPVPIARAWNTWESDFPARWDFLPLNLSLEFCAYSASANAFTRFPAGAVGPILGPRALDGNGVNLELRHCGTRLQLAYDKPDPFTLRGEWQAAQLGEWGLRFWVVLVLRWQPPGAADPVAWTFDEARGRLEARYKSTHVLFAGQRPPLLVTGHGSAEALAEEYRTNGYFYLDSRGTAGAVVAVRYNLEEMAQFRFALTVAQDKELAHSRLAGALTHPPRAALAPAQTGSFAGALDAVRDVIAWNNVWDGANRRPYVTISRNWVTGKFGGWGFFTDDVLLHGLMAGLFDPAMALENLRAVFASETAQGNLPCLVTGRDIWVDRTQPPIAAFLIWMLYLRTGSRDLLAEFHEPLIRARQWLWRVRDPDARGLLSYGTSPIGEGLYRGTKLAAKDESFMDNSPMHDEATLESRTWTLDCADVGLNSLAALDGEMIANVARALGHEALAREIDGEVVGLRSRIAERLWDEERQVFANRLHSGRFVRSLTPTSFFPLLAGAASPDQARAMAALLENPAKFGGDWLLASVTRDDPSFADNVYWRGRIWPPLNFLVYFALRRAGLGAAARMLAENSQALFMGEWREHRRAPENFSAVTGAALDQPDTDTFYGWGALMPFIAVCEVLSVDPWEGVSLTLDGVSNLGPILTPWGAARLTVVAHVTSLAVGERVLLRTNLTGRMSNLRLDSGGYSLDLPALREDNRWIEWPAIPAQTVIAAHLDGRPLDLRDGPVAGCQLPRRSHPSRLELWVRAPGAPEKEPSHKRPSRSVRMSKARST